VLNSGHSRPTAFVLRTVGDDFEPRKFSTWAPIAIACINKLPDTLMDRSIVIQMRRKTAAEAAQSFDDDAREALAELQRKIVRWIGDNGEALGAAKPSMPAGFANRLADNWRPLLVIADTAGGKWAALGRDVALRLSNSAMRDDGDVKVTLLADIRALFEAQEAEKLFSESICEALAGVEGRPWADWNHGKPISKNGLAKVLKAFDVSPRGSIRIGSATNKGYYLSDFREAFDRYLPAQTVTTSQPLGENEFRDSQSVTVENDVTDENISLANGEKGCDVVPDRIPPVSIIYENPSADRPFEEFYANRY
jgi:putative DNA primase/helicase